MHLRAWTVLGFLLAGCATSDSSTTGSGATPVPVTSGSPDAGTFTFSGDAAVEAGPLLASCDPTNPGSCPTGFTCFAQHTSSTWWVDLYGTCTFNCDGTTFAQCDSLDGVCGCPVLQGQTSADCAADGGAAMVCVPALKPGTPAGSNEGDGGCGTPGCGGGSPVEAGPLATDAAAE